MNKKIKSNLMLLLTAFIWGSAFIGQSKGADLLGPFTFNTFRYGLAVIALLPVIFFLNSKKKSSKDFTELSLEEKAVQKKILLIGGLATGFLLFVSSGLQQYAMAFTTAANAGFITTLYVILVPIVGFLFLKKKIRPLIWFCAVLGVVGLYLLAIKPGTFTIGRGDLFVLICAFGFTAHILVIDHFSPKTDGVKLSCIQFAIVSVLSCLMMLFTEEVEMELVIQAIIPLLYTGVLSSAVAYTLQIVAQKDADPTVASLILSLESVFAAICGVIFLHEGLSLRETLGCVIVFIAIILAQLPSKEERLTN